MEAPFLPASEKKLLKIMSWYLKIMRNSLKVKVFVFQNIDVTSRQSISYVQIQVIVFERVSHYFEILCQYFGFYTQKLMAKIIRKKL